MREITPPRSVPEQRHLPYLLFFNKYVVLFHSGFILLLSLFYTDHSVSIILFNYDYLNSTTILSCLCFNSLYYHFVNLNFICKFVHMPAFHFILHMTLKKKSEILKYISQ